MTERHCFLWNASQSKPSSLFSTFCGIITFLEVCFWLKIDTFTSHWPSGGNEIWPHCYERVGDATNGTNFNENSNNSPWWYLKSHWFNLVHILVKVNIPLQKCIKCLRSLDAPVLVKVSTFWTVCSNLKRKKDS